LYVYTRAVEEEGRRRGDMKFEEEGRPLASSVCFSITNSA
jgi:hypothetical protein